MLRRDCDRIYFLAKRQGRPMRVEVIRGVSWCQERGPALPQEGLESQCLGQCVEGDRFFCSDSGKQPVAYETRRTPDSHSATIVLVPE